MIVGTNSQRLNMQVFAFEMCPGLWQKKSVMTESCLYVSLHVQA